ncbi:hypothetical protein KHQ06_02275 [Nocardia tengchongensis]|uniref:Uncharacterized protein n=1 Tax=Nocardia tengchongensis TaxID=2055889 RepID=A0ABX8CRP7_9NOCA|nr:hypothetical protein [Nocardia tengchongensis]QVI22006.1 hypothetical protein KHQ06_02275 [Nocardia tengchongensis]
MDEYLAQLRELEVDVSALESLGVTVIDAAPPVVLEKSWSPADVEQEELER